MPLAQFSNSPLSEVVLGVEFNAPDFSSVHFGLYWQAIRERFPKQYDKPPLDEGVFVIEQLPPLRRVWFEADDKKQIIQLQRDRFFYNWRCQDNTREYPHFELIYPRFLEEWDAFGKWWTDNADLPIFPMRYQLTYLNQIDSNRGWDSSADHHKIFTFTGRHWDNFLSAPSLQVSNIQFDLPDNLGFLLVRVIPTLDINQKPTLNFELMSRSLDATFDIKEWFEGVHEYTVKAFLDLTTSSIQKEWGLL